MGRKGDGLDVRDAGIRIRFTRQSVRQRQTLRINSKPLAPTVANIKYARRMVVEIDQKIRDGIFSMVEYFPASGDAGSLTVSNHLIMWLDTQRIEESTKNGYKAAINFWSTAIGAKALSALLPSHILKAGAARPDLTGKTLNNYTSVLREALELAVTDGLLQSNPEAKVEAAAHQKEPPDPFTNEEAERIMAEFNARHPGQVANPRGVLDVDWHADLRDRRADLGQRRSDQRHRFGQRGYGARGAQEQHQDQLGKNDQAQ